jgi:hypothetical protein
VTDRKGGKVRILEQRTNVKYRVVGGKTRVWPKESSKNPPTNFFAIRKMSLHGQCKILGS